MGGALDIERQVVVASELSGVVPTAALGQKHDAGKPRLELMQFKALERYGRVLTYGAQKYAPDGWRHVVNAKARYVAAALRHVFAWMRGEARDPESGEHHLAHAICSLMFVLELLCDEGNA